MQSQAKFYEYFARIAFVPLSGRMTLKILRYCSRWRASG
jgi:hypothetical protein